MLVPGAPPKGSQALRMRVFLNTSMTSLILRSAQRTCPRPELGARLEGRTDIDAARHKAGHDSSRFRPYWVSTGIVFQNPLGRPACFKIAFASTGLRMLDGTVKVRCVIGLNQIS